MEGIKKNRDFSAVFQSGRSKADAFLVLYRKKRGQGALEGPSLCTQNARIGISVSKKVGNSVVRHRVKRRVKEICRLHAEAFPAGYDYVWIARKGAAEASYERLEQSVLGLVRKMNGREEKTC